MMFAAMLCVRPQSRGFTLPIPQAREREEGTGCSRKPRSTDTRFSKDSLAITEVKSSSYGDLVTKPLLRNLVGVRD